MGIICRLLGHDWGDVSVRHNVHFYRTGDLKTRSVETVREYQHCPRCGEEHCVGFRKK